MKIVKLYRFGYVVNLVVLCLSVIFRDLDELRVVRGFSLVCISESGICGSVLFGLVIICDVEFVCDCNILFFEVMIFVDDLVFGFIEKSV